MATDHKTLVENVAHLEGQVVALRQAVAMLIYSHRTALPFEHVYREISSSNQLFDEGHATAFPEQRVFFTLGLSSGRETVLGMG